MLALLITPLIFVVCVLLVFIVPAVREKVRSMRAVPDKLEPSL